MVRNSVRRRGKSSHPCFQFTQWLHEIKHSKSPGRWCQSPLRCCVKCIIIKPWADIFKKVSPKPLSLIYAQNTLGVFGLSGNTGKGIFTVQIATQALTLRSAQNRVNLGVAGNMKVTEWILSGIWVFQVVWYLRVVLFVCISFQLKLFIIYIIPVLWSSSQCTYTSSFPLFPSFISLYARYQQNKDRTGNTALGKQLLSDPASQI